MEPETRLCDLLTEILERWNSITKSRPNHDLDNFGILLRTQLLTRHPILYNNAGLSRHHSPGNWRTIICETDSGSSSVSFSSENVSPKGAKFEEDPHTYSLKASLIVSPTFGDNDGNR